jgi:HSP20 family protein
MIHPVMDLLSRLWPALQRRFPGTGHRRLQRAATQNPSGLAGECWETAQSVIVKLELPGVSPEDIHVSCRPGALRVRGEKRAFDGHAVGRYHFMERAFGRFERTVPLPHHIDAAKAEISYRDGVLTVVVPKTDTLPPK